MRARKSEGGGTLAAAEMQTRDLYKKKSIKRNDNNDTVEKVYSDWGGIRDGGGGRWPAVGVAAGEEEQRWQCR